MAIKATIFKTALQIADMDRHYYADHALTLARHPSETGERMMVRLLAFAMYANEFLTFGKGISGDDEPDIAHKDLTGAISYGRSADIWWNENSKDLQRLKNLTVIKLPTDTTLALAALANRTMQLQYTVQEGHIMMTSDSGMIEIEPKVLLGKFGETN
jgi:uncharacterized protein YaeQ